MLEKKFLNGVEVVSVNADQLREKIKYISNKIKKDKPQVLRIILFGSFAKGNFTPYSDIDIAIIVKNCKKKFIERQDDFIEYFKQLCCDVNLVIYTQAEYKNLINSSSNFIKEIEQGMNL